MAKAGDRKMVAVGEEDKEMLDMWLTKPPYKVFIAVLSLIIPTGRCFS